MSGGRGAGDAPVTYQGEYDPTRTYLPRQLVTVTGTPYLSLAKQTGVAPPGASWLAFGGGGGGGDGFRPGTGSRSVVGADLFDSITGPALGTDQYALAIGGGTSAGYRSTVVGVFADAQSDYGVAIGYGASATGSFSSTAVGMFSVANAPSGGYASAFGRSAFATQDHATALGGGSLARSSYGVAIGYASQAGDNTFQDSAVSIGSFSGVFAHRGVALGTGAGCNEDDLGVVRVNNWEVVASESGVFETGLILRDSDNVRWRLHVDTSGTPSWAVYP